MRNDVLPAPSSSVELPIIRMVALTILLILEVLGLTLRHDTEGLLSDQRWWAYLLGEVHLLPSLALTIMVSAIVFGGDSLRSGFLKLVSQSLHSRSSWRLLLGLHLLSLGLLDSLSAQILNSSTNSGFAGDVGFGGWVLCVCVWVVTWCLAFWPRHLWWLFLSEFGVLLLSAMGMSLFAMLSARLTEWLWTPMADVTLTLVWQTLGLFMPEIISEPTERMIGTASFLVQIAPSCSGYEGLGLVGSVVGLYLWFRRAELRFPRAFLLLPMALLAVWIANFIRIVVLILIGASGWPDVARGGFHSQAGWISFNMVALGFVLLSQRIHWFNRQSREAQITSATNPATVYLLPLIGLVGTAMMTSALMTEGFDKLYPVRVLIGIGVIAWLGRDIKSVLARVAFRWTSALEVALVGSGVFGLWILLEFLIHGSPTGQSPPAELTTWSTSSKVFWLTCRIFGAMLIVPLAEELAFRGYLYRRLESVNFDQVELTRWAVVPALLSSLIFGVLHPDRWLAGVLAGMAYLLLMLRRGSLLEATLAHALTNGLLAWYVLQTDSWGLW